jgi:ureidoacrylate peracid hydrolase
MMNAFLRAGAPSEIQGGRRVIPKLKRLITVCRDKGIKIIFTTHIHRKDGSDLGLTALFRPGIETTNPLREGSSDIEFFDDIQPEKDDIVIVKRRFSAFFGTELDMILRSNEVDTLIIGGVATNVCCESTARDARIRDYRVLFLSDGTAAWGLPDAGWGEISQAEAQKYVLTTMAFHFAEVLPVEKAIDRILKHPG